MSQLTDSARKYVHCVEKMELDAATAAQLLHPDYEQWELPNALNRAGQKSDIDQTIVRMQTARKILQSQRFEIQSTLEQSQTVVLECLWSGTMAIDAGALKKGQTLRAFFCMFFEFKDGKIHRVRNYDCFEPFGA